MLFVYIQQKLYKLIMLGLGCSINLIACFVCFMDLNSCKYL